jgi:hypothetical protein
MKLHASIVVVLIGCALVPRSVQARWDSKADNKSPETLEAMTDKELFNEAFDVCVRRAMVERQASDSPGLVANVTTDASDYLDVISEVAGKRHGGRGPGMPELTEAHTVKKCQAAFRTFLASQENEPQPRPTRKAGPRVAKKPNPAPHHGDPREQLPPWFAPPAPANGGAPE